MVITLFLLLGLAAEYWSRRCVWSTVVWRPSEIWLVPPKFKWFTWPNHAPFWDGLPYVG